VPQSPQTRATTHGTRKRPAREDIVTRRSGLDRELAPLKGRSPVVGIEEILMQCEDLEPGIDTRNRHCTVVRPWSWAHQATKFANGRHRPPRCRANPPLDVLASPQSLVEGLHRIPRKRRYAQVRDLALEHTSAGRSLEDSSHPRWIVDFTAPAQRDLGASESLERELESVRREQLVVVEECHVLPSGNGHAAVPSSGRTTVHVSANEPDPTIGGHDDWLRARVVNDDAFQLANRLREHRCDGLAQKRLTTIGRDDH
jgi:hypothetical protein